jgi:DNA-binding NarL/FixJ family response regulator
MKLLLVDKREIFREGLSRLLASQPGIEVVGACGSGTEAIEKVRQLKPDVIILDTEIEDDSPNVACRIRKALPNSAQILMLTHSEEHRDLFDALKCGARGYLTKDATISDLVKAVNIIAEGGVIISPPMASKMLQELNSLNTAERRESTDYRLQLTKREKEVLTLIGRGATNREIASTLSIAENTVKVHLRNIMEKLQVQSRLQAALMARGKGFNGEVTEK